MFPSRTPANSLSSNPAAAESGRRATVAGVFNDVEIDEVGFFFSRLSELNVLYRSVSVS